MPAMTPLPEEREDGNHDGGEYDHAERALGPPISGGLLIWRARGFALCGVIPRVVALARRVVEAGARNADRFPDAGTADRHVRAAKTNCETRARGRQVQRKAGTQVQASVKAQAHASGF